MWLWAGFVCPSQVHIRRSIEYHKVKYKKFKWRIIWTTWKVRCHSNYIASLKLRFCFERNWAGKGNLFFWNPVVQCWAFAISCGQIWIQNRGFNHRSVFKLFLYAVSATKGLFKTIKHFLKGKALIREHLIFAQTCQKRKHCWQIKTENIFPLCWKYNTCKV